jgi:phage nucleotide-binding protein
MIKSTANPELQHLKFLVHGPAGSGKTYMARTCDNDGGAIVLSCESGTLSLADHGIDFLDIGSMDMLVEAFKWLKGSDEADEYAWVVLDSITEIAGVCLSEEKRQCKDPRAAYGNMQDRVKNILRSFRGLPKHVYFSAKQARENVDQALLYCPSMPGKTLTQKEPIAHDFDFVFALCVEENEDDSQHPRRYLVTQNDGTYEAKSRDPQHVLDQQEAPDLGRIRRKIMGEL